MVKISYMTRSADGFGGGFERGMEQPPIHQTQPAEQVGQNLLEERAVLEQLRDSQRIEGGGPPRPVDFEAMPAPVRLFGYFFIAAFAASMVGVLIVTVWK